MHLGSEYRPIYISSSNLDGYVATCEFVAGESVYFDIICALGSHLEVSVTGAIVTMDGEALPDAMPYGYSTICVTAIEEGTFEIVFAYTEA